VKPLHKILLVNLIVSLGIAILSFTVPAILGSYGDAIFFGLLVGFLLIVVQGLVCFICSIVYFVKRNQSRGLGFLLGGFLAWVIGFGTCSATMFTL
jgi:hypothetical protein